MGSVPQLRWVGTTQGRPFEMMYDRIILLNMPGEVRDVSLAVMRVSGPATIIQKIVRSFNPDSDRLSFPFEDTLTTTYGGTAFALQSTIKGHLSQFAYENIQTHDDNESSAGNPNAVAPINTWADRLSSALQAHPNKGLALAELIRDAGYTQIAIAKIYHNTIITARTRGITTGDQSIMEYGMGQFQVLDDLPPISTIPNPHYFQDK